MATEDGYSWIDSDESWDMVDDLPTRDRVVSPVSYYSSSDSDKDGAEMLEDYLSGVLCLPRRKGIVENFIDKRRPRLEDVVKEHVLPFLPAKSLCRFRTVCKDWDKWIASPFFAHRQALVFQGFSGIFSHTPDGDTSFAGLDRYVHGVPDSSLIFLPEQVLVLASHNGLLCCRGQETCNYYVCNPVTRKWERLPNPNFHHGSKTAVGLVLDMGVFNFKANFEIVCVIPQTDSEFVIFEIYSSRTNSWRHIIDVCPELQDGNLIGNGLYSKGHVYWMVDSGFLLVFDVKIDVFGIMKQPTGCGPRCALSEVGGELCFLEPWEDGSGWLYIRLYGGMDMRLKTIIRLHIRSEEGEKSLRVLGLANDNILLLDVGRELIAYGLTGKTVRILDHWAGSTDFARHLPYVNSLVTVCRPSSQLLSEDY